MPNNKRKDLRRKQRHQHKLHFLRKRLIMSKDLTERENIIEKIRRLSPQAPITDYLAAR